MIGHVCKLNDKPRALRLKRAHTSITCNKQTSPTTCQKLRVTSNSGAKFGNRGVQIQASEFGERQNSEEPVPRPRTA